jgi:hypothetical protein
MAHTEETRERLGARVRRGVVEAPRSLEGRARARRWESMIEHFPALAEMSVLDLGGTVSWWRRAPITPRRLVVLSGSEPGESRRDRGLFTVVGDPCGAAGVLGAARIDSSFDVVMSESLIEHVGGHARRLRFAEQVHALAPYHWVQTHYRYFPLDPDWRLPGTQFLPVAARAEVAAHWPRQRARPADRAAACREVQWTELLGGTEMRAYFPGSRILHERLFGIVESLVAVVSPNDG